MKSFKGIVQKGSKRAARLGYPTINIPLHDAEVDGIFAAHVSMHGSEEYTAVAFADQSRRVLEAHILDFSGDLYGLEVQVELREKIRDTAVFRNDDDLREAIQDDIAKVREYFRKPL